VLKFVYALALVGLTTEAIEPYLDEQGWMMAASLLSFAFLVFGAFTRVWAVAAMGQAFLLVALEQFFFPTTAHGEFPWTWLAAAVPIVVVFITARGALEWTTLFTEIPVSWRGIIRFVAHTYLLIALAMVVRWVLAIVAPMDQVGAFLFLGTLVLSWNVRHENSFGVRCSYALTGLGTLFYLSYVGSDATVLVTFLNGLAVVLFLSQPALLRHEGKSLVTRAESWTLILLSTALAWIFASAGVELRINPHYLTLGWSLTGLFIFIYGLIVREPRFRWCALGIILATILRVGCYDMWGLSTGFRVLTFFVLAIVTLAIGAACLRRGR